MKHKIVTSPANSTKLNITLADNDAELAVKLREIKGNKNKRLWWFGSNEPEQKKEDKS